jgi:hypothetical protein
MHLSVTPRFARAYDKLGVRSRRLSKDYEMLTENSEGIVSLASIQRLLKHLVPATSFSNAL